MESYGANEARLKMRDILSAVERGEPVELKRYDTPTGVIVPVDWFDAVDDLLADLAAGGAALEQYYGTAIALRKGRRAAGAEAGQVVDHIDGDPTNNDPKESKR